MAFKPGQKVKDQFGRIKTVVKQQGSQVFTEEEQNQWYHESNLFDVSLDSKQIKEAVAEGLMGALGLRSNAKAALLTAQHELKIAEATCHAPIIETARRNYVTVSQAWESERRENGSTESQIVADARSVGLEIRNLAGLWVVSGGPQYITIQKLEQFTRWVRSKYGSLANFSSGTYWHGASQSDVTLPKTV